jgi:hypothetical protein
MSSIPIFWQQVIGVLVRVVVTFVTGWLEAHGGPHFTDSQIANFVIGAVPVVAMAAWGIWQRYGSRLKLVTAIANPQLQTEHEVEAHIANPLTLNPSVNTPKDEVPIVAPITERNP